MSCPAISLSRTLRFCPTAIRRMEYFLNMEACTLSLKVPSAASRTRPRTAVAEETILLRGLPHTFSGKTLEVSPLWGRSGRRHLAAMVSALRLPYIFGSDLCRFYGDWRCRSLSPLLLSRL